MIQVLALRSHNDPNTGVKKTYETWFEKGIRAESVDGIFLDPISTLSAIEESERWNVYYTVSECAEERGRKFLSQEHIPFDIDGLALPEGENPEAVARIASRLACDALGVDFDEVGVLFSGNGVQLLIGIKEPFTEVTYFDDARHHYRACCDQINLKLQEHKVQGRADPSVWSPARLLRHPETYNRKPGKPERKALVLQPNIVHGDFTLEKASRIPVLKPGDQIDAKAAKELFNCDPKAILDEKRGCDFLKWAKQNPNDIHEPQWYAMLSIVGRFPEGAKYAHEFSKGHKKYSYQETEVKLRHAIDSKSGPRTCENIKTLWDGCQNCPNFGKVTSPITIEGPDSIKTLNTGFRFQKTDRKDARPGPVDLKGLTRYFGRTHEFVAVKDSPNVYAFTGKRWESLSKTDLHIFAQENVRPEPLMRERAEFESFVRLTNAVPVDHFTKTPEGVFNFQNGIFDLSSGELKPHDKAYPFRHILPCDYDPLADAPRFRKFIKEVTCERENIELCLQEYLGYIIAGGPCKFQKALLLLGEGSNGKSTFTNVVRWLTGKANCSLSSKDLPDPQKRVSLMGKLANIAEENSKNSFRNVEVMKNMISGGLIWAKQLWEQPFEFQNQAKLIILCNELPQNFDNTHGFYRRLLIVPFDAMFDISTGTADVNLDDKLQAELSGIFNYAIEGYRRLMMQNGFTEPVESQALLQEYSLESDTVKAWFEDEVEVVKIDGVFCHRTELYESYKNHCSTNGIPYPESSVMFFKRLKAILRSKGVEWREGRKLVSDRKVRVIAHIKFKENYFPVIGAREAGMWGNRPKPT